MKFVSKLMQSAKEAAQSRMVRLAFLGTWSALYTAQAHAQFQLPMGDFFCQVAGAMQSQWAPGIILICIIVEAFLFLVVKKGILQMLMVVVLAATLALGAGSFLRMIKPNAACAAVS